MQLEKSNHPHLFTRRQPPGYWAAERSDDAQLYLSGSAQSDFPIFGKSYFCSTALQSTVLGIFFNPLNSILLFLCHSKIRLFPSPLHFSISVGTNTILHSHINMIALLLIIIHCHCHRHRHRHRYRRRHRHRHWQFISHQNWENILDLPNFRQKARQTSCDVGGWGGLPE